SDYLGLIILMGLIVSIPTIIVGYLWATRVAVKISIEGEDNQLAYEEVLKQFGELPSTVKSFAPLVLPIILIALGSVVSFLQYEGVGASLLLFLGSPIVALFVGVLCSFLLLPALNEE